jgi:hypothetical protein
MSVSKPYTRCGCLSALEVCWASFLTSTLETSSCINRGFGFLDYLPDSAKGASNWFANCFVRTAQRPDLTLSSHACMHEELRMRIGPNHIPFRILNTSHDPPPKISILNLSMNSDAWDIAISRSTSIILLSTSLYVDKISRRVWRTVSLDRGTLGK